MTGANFNPAISLGPMIATDNFTNAWLYVTAPICGAIIAALVHKILKLLAEDEMVAQRAPPRPNDHLQARKRARSRATLRS